MSSLEYESETGVLVHDIPAWRILWAFLAIGARSWGGGSGTIWVASPLGRTDSSRFRLAITRAAYSASWPSIIGITAPPFLAIGLGQRVPAPGWQSWVVGATRGITASAVGPLAAVGYSFTVPLLSSPASLAIILATLVALFRFKADGLPVLLGGGVVGVGLYFSLKVPLA